MSSFFEAMFLNVSCLSGLFEAVLHAIFMCSAAIVLVEFVFEVEALNSFTLEALTDMHAFVKFIVRKDKRRDFSARC